MQQRSHRIARIMGSGLLGGIVFGSIPPILHHFSLLSVAAWLIGLVLAQVVMFPLALLITRPMRFSHPRIGLRMNTGMKDPIRDNLKIEGYINGRPWRRANDGTPIFGYQPKVKPAPGTCFRYGSKVIVTDGAYQGMHGEIRTEKIRTKWLVRLEVEHGPCPIAWIEEQKLQLLEQRIEAQFALNDRAIALASVSVQEFADALAVLGTPAWYSIRILDGEQSERYGSGVYATVEEVAMVSTCLKQAYDRMFWECDFAAYLRDKTPVFDVVKAG